MDAWLLITFAAATFQTLRFVLQKRLSAKELSAAGATFARFIYSFPFAFAIALAYQQISAQAWPQIAPAFWAYCVIGERPRYWRRFVWSCCWDGAILRSV